MSLTKASQGEGLVDMTEGVGLGKQVTLLNSITIIVGCIIGSGIFITPTGVLEGAGSIGLTLIVWTLSGVFSAIGSYCYVELGLMIKKSGADYAYIYEAYGAFVAFLRLWVECIVVRPGCMTVVAIAFAEYALKPFYPDCEVPLNARRLMAGWCIMLLTCVNCYSVKLATRVQDIFTIGKVIALIVIIITGIVWMCMGHTANFDGFWEGSKWDPMPLSLAFYSGLFAYSGWNYLNFVMEEIIEPEKNLKKSIAISLSLVTIVYVMVNIAYFAVVSKNEMLTSLAVGVTFANKVYGSFAFIVPLFVACSTFGTVNGILFTSARLFYAGAREGHMPEVLTMINPNRLTPVPAVMAVSFLSIFYLGSSSVGALINNVSICIWLAIGVAILSLITMRWTHPQLPRPIKISLIWPILYVIVTIYLTIVPTIAKPAETGIGLAIMATGVPVYLIFIYPKKRPRFIANIMGKITRFMQKLFVLVKEE